MTNGTEKKKTSLKLSERVCLVVRHTTLTNQTTVVMAALWTIEGRPVFEYRSSGNSWNAGAGKPGNWGRRGVFCCCCNYCVITAGKTCFRKGSFIDFNRCFFCLKIENRKCKWNKAGTENPKISCCFSCFVFLDLTLSWNKEKHDTAEFFQSEPHKIYESLIHSPSALLRIMCWAVTSNKSGERNCSYTETNDVFIGSNIQWSLLLNWWFSGLLDSETLQSCVATQECCVAMISARVRTWPIRPSVRWTPWWSEKIATRKPAGHHHRHLGAPASRLVDVLTCGRSQGESRSWTNRMLRGLENQDDWEQRWRVGLRTT